MEGYKDMKYEVWFLLKGDVCMKEIYSREFSSFRTACGYAYDVSIIAIDPCFVSAHVYQNINGLRHKLANFDGGQKP